MGTLKSVARKAMKKSAPRKAKKASEEKGSMLNRAGGIAFDIESPIEKLLTMTGGSFFAEPKFYDGSQCVPTRGEGGRFNKLQERLRLTSGKAAQFTKCDELDDVAKEVIATAVDVLEGDSPDDLLRLANWLRNEGNIRLTPQVLLVLSIPCDGV